MALFNNDGNLVEGTEGTTVEVINDKYSYWGDGDGSYYSQAIVARPDGTFERVSGENRLNNYCRYSKQNVVDAPAEVVAAYKAKVAYDNETHRIKKANEDAYVIERGRIGYVEKGSTKRGRKNQGRYGVIFWHGFTKFGYSVGIEDATNGERFFVNGNYVAVIPDWQDAWVDLSAEVA